MPLLLLPALLTSFMCQTICGPELSTGATPLYSHFILVLLLQVLLLNDFGDLLWCLPFRSLLVTVLYVHNTSLQGNPHLDYYNHFLFHVTAGLTSHYLDFITGLPLSNGYTTILTIVDCFSEMAHFFPLVKLPSAKETAELLVSCIPQPWIHPQDIVSDHNLQLNFGQNSAAYRDSLGSL